MKTFKIKPKPAGRIALGAFLITAGIGHLTFYEKNSGRRFPAGFL
ncbi:hypothetical protein [Parafilimonas sp.]